MTDHDALVRAICEFPDDDTPRLIYADFLEENGEGERAAFVRAQVELARTPAWEPFAVLCRHRKKEWSEAGEPFRDSLPELEPESGVEWHPQAFRRGLGWRVKVGSLHAWKRIAPRLYEKGPVGELDLNPPSVRDDWIEFAQSETIRHLRVVHLNGPSPVEPIRALCDSPYSTGITDIHFHRASSPGLPELIEDLLASPLGKGLKGLHFRVGFESLDYLIDALGGAESTRLERLTFETMGMTPALMDRLLLSKVTSELQELDLRNDRLGTEADGTFVNWFARLPPSIETLRVTNSEIDSTAMDAMANCEQVHSLKCVDLSHNYEADYYPRLFDNFGKVRLLALEGIHLTSENLRFLTHAPVWSSLVELDLRDTRLAKLIAQYLLAAHVPSDLTALILDTSSAHATTQTALRSHFGERLVLTS